jgi:hypothetical protein
MDIYDAIELFGNRLVYKSTESKLVVINQDMTESDFVKGFNRGEEAAFEHAYQLLKYTLTESIDEG